METKYWIILCLLLLAFEAWAFEAIRYHRQLKHGLTPQEINIVKNTVKEHLGKSERSGSPLPKHYFVNKDESRWDMNQKVERKLICSDPNVNPYDYEIIAISLAGMPFVKKGLEWKHFDTCSPLRETKHPIKNIWRRPFIAYRGTEETILICKKIC